MNTTVRNAAAALLVLSLVGCTSFARRAAGPCIVGVATMEADSSLSLWLRAEEPGGPIGHATLVYRPGEPNYEATLDHVGPISPGESKPVPCWPDDD